MFFLQIRNSSSSTFTTNKQAPAFYKAKFQKPSSSWLLSLSSRFSRGKTPCRHHLTCQHWTSCLHQLFGQFTTPDIPKKVFGHSWSLIRVGITGLQITGARFTRTTWMKGCGRLRFWASNWPISPTKAVRSPGFGRETLKSHGQLRLSRASWSINCWAIWHVIERSGMGDLACQKRVA